MTTSTSGRWPVLLAGRGIRELRLLAEDKRTFEIVKTKLKELSHGQFTTDNHLPVRGSTENIPIYRARLSNDLRIIYSIDLASDGQFDHQIIKVFSISSRARVTYDFWVKVSRYLAKQGAEYRNRCITREYLDTPQGQINIPTSFDHQEYVPIITASKSILDPEVEMNELHETIALEKFTPVTKSLYNSILANMEAILPMALNLDEKKIVRHQGTSVVIGRSGTGKTTALIYKMRANAQLSARSEDLRPARQLFVTRSKVLTNHIASNYRGLVESSEIAHKSVDELEKIRKTNQKYQTRELVEFDNEVDLRDDLPNRFSQLTDAHFPLFISFDKLCQLLEADTHARDDALTSPRYQARKLITYSDFKHRYWPKFNHRLTHNLNPALVFSEILGVIKGYGHNLSQEEYLVGLSDKKSPLLANVRVQVYAIFEAYTKKCRRSNEIDAADRTQAILANYQSNLDSLAIVDNVFVDEVQDHLMADIYLLSSLCSNLDGGYWCGDTAQTINVGSSFRIKDLKAFIYEKMVSKTYTSHAHRKVAAPFATFELTVNYRSHGGIVRYAASLVELIYTLFPSSIDHMKPESATAPGAPPVLFVSPENDESHFVHNLLGGRTIDQATPFGAQQAIIVRSESTVRSLEARLQKRCTVLSLLETKGLEFDDLILYNFFTESEAPPSAWRAILNLHVISQDGHIRYEQPRDLDTILPVLCSELKQLSLEDLSRFAASSADLRQWAYRGQEFFSTGLYALAQSCFERAGQEKEAAIADAYHHMSEARKLEENSEAAKQAFILAARKMEACVKSGSSSQSAATLWYHAATCFEAAQEVSRASQAYCQGGFYNQAALLLFESQDMDGCLNIWMSHSHSMDAATAQRIKEVSSIHFLRERKYEQLQKLFRGSLAQCIDLARSLRFSSQLKDLLGRNQQFQELANAHLDDGLPVEAVHCLLQNLENNSAIEQSREIISTYLWATFGFNMAPDANSMDQATKLLQLSQRPPLSGASDLTTRHDLRIFTMIASSSQPNASLSLDSFHDSLKDLCRDNEEDRLRITLIQHHVLRQTHWILSYSFETFYTHLSAWLEYAESIRRLQTLKYPSGDKAVCRFMGISKLRATKTPRTDNSVHVLNGSFVQQSTSKGRSGKGSQGRSTMMTTDTVDISVQTGLTNYLKKELVGLNSNLLESPWIQPTPPCMKKTSSWPSETKLDAIPQPEESIKIYSLAFKALESIKGGIYNVTTEACAKSDANRVQFIWIMQLFILIFPSTGSINSEALALRETDYFNIINAWVDEVLQFLDPMKHKHAFATFLIICLALASEFRPSQTPRKFVQPVARSSLPRGCHDKPDRFTGYIHTSFQHKSLEKLGTIVETIHRMTSNGLFVDISVLVHLIERVTRELIFVERAQAVRSAFLGGFSGLIMPASWALSLAIHGKKNQTLKPQPTDKLLGCVKNILLQLSRGIPDHWKVLNEQTKNHTLDSLTTRLLWLTGLVAVNLHPSHPSLPLALDILQSTIVNEPDLLSPSVGELKTSMDINPKIFSSCVDQKSCLSALSQTFQHEELVMLSGEGDLICPAKQHFVHRIITFGDFGDLHIQLCGSPNEQAATPEIQLQPDHLKPELTTEQAPVIASEPLVEAQADDLKTSNHIEASESPHPEASLSQVEYELVDPVGEVSTGLTVDEAAFRIQRALRALMNRRKPRPPLAEFDEEGRIYEQHNEDFFKVGSKTKARDRLGLKLVRGPCISIVVGLRALIEELDDYLEHLDEELQAPGLNTKDLANLQKSIQQRRAKLEGYKKDAIDHVPEGGTPKLLKVKNLGGVKTQTKSAWDVFMKVKNSEMLPYEERLERVEKLMAQGRDIILRATSKAG